MVKTLTYKRNNWKLTTEKIINNWVRSTIGINKPVWKCKPSIHSLSIFCVGEHPKHSGEKEIARENTVCLRKYLFHDQIQGEQSYWWKLPYATSFTANAEYWLVNHGVVPLEQSPYLSRHAMAWFVKESFNQVRERAFLTHANSK